MHSVESILKNLTSIQLNTYSKLIFKLYLNNILVQKIRCDSHGQGVYFDSKILCAADLACRDFVKGSTESLKTCSTAKRLWGFTVYLRQKSKATKHGLQGVMCYHGTLLLWGQLNPHSGSIL